MILKTCFKQVGGGYLESILKQAKLKNINKYQICDYKYNNLNIYPTFAQANIVTGINYSTVGSITFSGENSRQRILLRNKKNKLNVLELNGKSNLKLMGFDNDDFKRIKAVPWFTENIIRGLAGNSIPVNVLVALFKTCLLSENNNEL